MRGWRSIWLVARREAKERAKSKAFIASTAITILLVGAVIAVILLTDDAPPDYRVAYVGDSPSMLAELVDASAAASDATVTPSRQTDRQEVAAALEAGDLDAAVLNDDTLLFGPGHSGHLETILEVGLSQARLLQLLEAAGIDSSAAATALGPGAIRIISTAEDSVPSNEAIAFATVVLLFIVITTYGQWVLMGVLEEKSTRVVELVVSSTSVRSLLAGKVIGIGVLALAQLAVLITLSITAGTLLDLFELPGGTAATVAWSLIWFVMGFAFYAVLNAAAGSLVSQTEDAQAVATPIALLGVASYLLAFAVIIPNPDSTLSTLMSLIPPIAPIAFPARIAAMGVPLWQNLAGIVVMIAAVVGVIRLAARVYAGALLAAGGRIKVRDAWRAAGELTASR